MNKLCETQTVGDKEAGAIGVVCAVIWVVARSGHLAAEASSRNLEPHPSGGEEA